jgi:hypothetical protein
VSGTSLKRRSARRRGLLHANHGDGWRSVATGLFIGAGPLQFEEKINGCCRSCRSRGIQRGFRALSDITRRELRGIE